MRRAAPLLAFRAGDGRRHGGLRRARDPACRGAERRARRRLTPGKYSPSGGRWREAPDEGARALHAAPFALGFRDAPFEVVGPLALQRWRREHRVTAGRSLDPNLVQPAKAAARGAP
jgi:hypothetical protein